MLKYKPGRHTVTLTDEVMKNFRVLRAYKYSFSLTRSLTWRDDGEVLLACNDNNSLMVCNLRSSLPNKTLYSKTNGINVVRFLDQTNNIIVCSCKAESNTDYKNCVRYWDISENKYVKSLPQIGNVCTMNGISVSSNKKFMLVNTDDGLVKLYYVNMNNADPLILYKSHFERPVSIFDNEGEIFIASFGKPKIHIYDVAMYSKGEINIFSLEKIIKKDEYITNLLFTPTNKYIIVSTNKNYHFKIDSLTGEFVCSYTLQIDPKIKTAVSLRCASYGDYSLYHNYGDNKNVKPHNYVDPIDSKYFDYDVDSAYSDTSSTKDEQLRNFFFFPAITSDEKYVIIGNNITFIYNWFPHCINYVNMFCILLV